jgi:hypothetical protein
VTGGSKLTLQLARTGVCLNECRLGNFGICGGTYGAELLSSISSGRSSSSSSLSDGKKSGTGSTVVSSGDTGSISSPEIFAGNNVLIICICHIYIISATSIHTEYSL